MNIKPYILKPIACAIILSFIFQDIVWSNPDIGSSPASTLQVPTRLQPFIDQVSFDKTLLELSIETILRSTDIEKFGYRITKPLTGELEGMQLDLDFSPPDKSKETGKIKRGDGWVIPCAVIDLRGGPQKGLQRKYEVFVRTDRSFVINEPDAEVMHIMGDVAGKHAVIADPLVNEPVRGYFKTRKFLATHGITVRDLDECLTRENLTQSFSGIRGIFGMLDTISAARSFITSLYAYHYISRAHKATGKSDLVFVIGRDTRPTGKAIRNAQIRGFIAYAEEHNIRLKIVDLGIIPKPVLLNAVKRFAADGGVMVTASHNPEQYNGFEYLNGANSANRPGALIDAEESEALIESFAGSVVRIKHGDEPAVFVILDMVDRRVEDIETDTYAVEEAVVSYVNFVKNIWGMNDPVIFADFIKRLSHRNVKVVLDPNGGAASGFDAKILRELGLECTEINTVYAVHSMNPDGIDGSVLAVQDAIDEIMSSDATFGMVFDCDAGRGLPVIRLLKGKTAEKLKPQETAAFNATVRLMWLKYIGALKGGKKPVVVSSDATSFITRDVAKGFGAEVVYCETGETNVISAMKAQADKGYMVALGVEGSNGGTVFGEAPCRDGVLTAISVAVALAYPELQRNLPGVSLKKAEGLDTSLEGLRDRLPKRNNINFKKEMTDIPLMAELAAAAENIFKERYWPHPRGRFLRYEIQYTKDKDCVVNDPRQPGKGMPSGEFGWKIVLYDKDDKASFAWMRLSQTVPNTMRFIVDSGDPEIAEYLVKMLEDMFSSAVKGINSGFSMRKAAHYMKLIFMPSDWLVDTAGPVKPYNKGSAKLVEVLKELRRGHNSIARQLAENKAASDLRKKQDEENARIIKKYHNTATLMLVAGLGFMGLGAASELVGLIQVIGAALVLIALPAFVALVGVNALCGSVDTVESFIRNLPIVRTMLHNRETKILVEMLEDIYDEEYGDHYEIKDLAFSNTGRGLFLQSIHTEGLLKIFRALEKDRPDAKTFFDFGSGDGRVAIIAGILGFKASGVEWSKELTDFSNSVLDKLKLKMYSKGIYRDLDVKLDQGNAMNAISPDHDIIFLALKGSPDMNELQDRINSLASKDTVVVAYHPQAPLVRLKPLYNMAARYPAIFGYGESSAMLYSPRKVSVHKVTPITRALSDLYITSQSGVTKLMIHDLGNTLLYVTLIVDQVRKKTEKTDPNFSEYCADIVEECKNISLYGTEAFDASEKNNFKDAGEAQKRFSAAVRGLSYMAASYQEQKIGNIYYSAENGLSDADNKRLRKHFNNIMKYLTFLSPDISEKGAPCDVNDVLDAVMAAEIEGDYIYEKDTANDYAESLPGAACDKMDLFRIFTNILRNAKQAQAGREGRASVRPETSSDGEFVKIVIEDNGPGMTPEQVESFNKGRDVNSTKGPGRGQGLRAVKLLVAKNGGTVKVSSEKSKGTIFTIRLPMAKTSDKSVKISDPVKDNKTSAVGQLLQKIRRSNSVIRSLKEDARVAFIIPVYNEMRRLKPKGTDNPLGEDALRRKIRQFQRMHKINDNFKWHIYIADDGSTDGSIEYIRSVWGEMRGKYPEGEITEDQLEIVNMSPEEKKKTGSKKGGAVLLGLRTARDDGWAQYIGYTDMDKSTDMQQTGILLDSLLSGKAEVAIGSRRAKGAFDVGPISGKISSVIGNYLVRLILPPLRDIKDTQRGFKLFNHAVLDRILDHATDVTFTFDTELLLLSKLAGYNIREEPIFWADSAKAATFRPSAEALGVLENLLKQSRHIRNNPFKEGAEAPDKSREHGELDGHDMWKEMAPAAAPAALKKDVQGLLKALLLKKGKIDTNEIEDIHTAIAVEICGGKPAVAAEFLGVSLATIYRNGVPNLYKVDDEWREILLAEGSLIPFDNLKKFIALAAIDIANGDIDKAGRIIGASPATVYRYRNTELRPALAPSRQRPVFEEDKELYKKFADLSEGFVKNAMNRIKDNLRKDGSVGIKKLKAIHAAAALEESAGDKGSAGKLAGVSQATIYRRGLADPAEFDDGWREILFTENGLISFGNLRKLVALAAIDVAAGDMEKAGKLLGVSSSAVYRYKEEAPESMAAIDGAETLPAIGFSAGIASTGSRSAEIEALIRRLSTPEKQDEAKDLASRSLVYRFVEDGRLRVVEKERIIPKDAMTYIRNGNEIVINEGCVAIAELKEGESIYTPGLNSCAALVARGKNKAGRDIYVLTHILPVIIHEQANAIARIVSEHIAGSVEVYIAGESSYEEPFNDLLMTVKKGLDSAGVVTNIDPVRNIWRDRGEVDDVLVTKSSFKAIRSNGADQERNWKAPALPIVLKTEHFNLPVVSRKDPALDALKVAGVQLPEGDFLKNTRAMEEIVTGMALWGARKPDIALFPESMDDIYSIHVDPSHRLETLQRVVDNSGISIGYFLESEYSKEILGKLNMTYTILRPGLQPLTFKKFKWESENRVFDIGGKKAAILICKESDGATSISANEVSQSPFKKADVILIAAGTDMPGSENWPRELSIMYRKPSVFVNFGGPKGLMRQPSSFVFGVEDSVHSRVELSEDAIIYADVRQDEPGVAEDIYVPVIDNVARERAADISEEEAFFEPEGSGTDTESTETVASSEAQPALVLPSVPAIESVSETGTAEGRGSLSYEGTALRDLTSEDQLVQTMVEKILSISLTKKVVFAFDPKLGGMHSAKVRAVFEVIKELKKDPKFEKFLRTRNIEVLPKLKDVDRFAGVDNAEVFVFTRDAVGVPVAGNVHTAIVNEKDFPVDAYYPLAEIVAISLSNFLDSSTLSRAIMIAKKLNIDSIIEADGRLVFTLLPSAKEHELQELVRRYARLKDLLRNA